MYKINKIYCNRTCILNIDVLIKIFHTSNTNTVSYQCNIYASFASKRTHPISVDGEDLSKMSAL